MSILSEALSKMFPARARKALKPGVILAVLLLGPLGTLIVYSALDPYFTWYFRDFHSQIIVDGKPSQGRVHRDHSGGSLFVTRTDVHEAMTYMIIIAPLEHQFSGLCRAMNRPELAEDPRFKLNADRLINLTELVATIEGWLQSMPSDDASMAAMKEYRVPPPSRSVHQR